MDLGLFELCAGCFHFSVTFGPWSNLSRQNWPKTAVKRGHEGEDNRLKTLLQADVGYTG